MTTTAQLTLAIGALFASVAVATGYVVLDVLRRRAPGRQRLQGAAEANAFPTNLPLSVSEFDPRLARMSRLLPRSPKEMSRLQRRMGRAGYRRPMAPVWFTIVELGLPLILGLVSFSALGATRGVLVGALTGIAGYMAPGFWLAGRTAKRKKLIENGLADALDLLIVCVEAGVGLDQAIAKTADELTVSHPALSEELGMITTEIRAGKPRMEAFKNFAERTGSDDVRQLVAILVQTDRFGTSIAQALRTQADVSRTMRRQRAEERAQKLGVKLVFPLVFCLFPAMFVVTLGPAAIKIARFFAAT